MLSLIHIFAVVQPIHNCHSVWHYVLRRVLDADGLRVAVLIHVNRFLGVGNLVAQSPLIKRLLDLRVGDVLSSLDCVVQALMLLLPANKGARRDAESLGNLVVRGSLDCQRPSPCLLYTSGIYEEGDPQLNEI